MTIVVLGLRGFAAVLVLTVLVGGMPRIAQAALAITIGLWSAMLVLGARPIDPTWQLALHELAIGAALGVMAAIPLLAAVAAGSLVDLAATGRAQGPYSLLFGVLAAAVFVGIDGHVAVVTAIVDSHTRIMAVSDTRLSVLGAIAQLVPAAVRLAVPWLVTAAVVQIAVGVGVRVASRAGVHAPAAAAVPAALAMMTAALVSTLAIAMVALMRGVI